MDHRPLRAVRYVRVSRLDQNPRLQEDETIGFIERRGWKLTDTFVDHGVSGSREKRPALDRMMAEARKGKFDILLVWRSDRLFRSLRHTVNSLAELEAMGAVQDRLREQDNGRWAGFRTGIQSGDWCRVRTGGWTRGWARRRRRFSSFTTDSPRWAAVS